MRRFMCMHAQEVLFSNKIYKKACNIFLKMVVKKLFSLQNVIKKIVGNALLFGKNCLQIPKMVTPPIKNNSPSLIVLLNPKSTGLFSPGAALGGVFYPPPPVKLDPYILES